MAAVSDNACRETPCSHQSVQLLPRAVFQRPAPRTSSSSRMTRAGCFALRRLISVAGDVRAGRGCFRLDSPVLCCFWDRGQLVVGLPAWLPARVGDFFDLGPPG